MSRFKTFALSIAGAAALAAAAAQAQAPVSPASTNPATVQPGSYALDPSHTRVLFSVSHMGFSTWYGDFTGVKGSARLDPHRPAASEVQVTIPTASISTTNATLDGELKSADWFDAARFPTISFRSRKITVTGPNRGFIDGDVTLHGVTRPVRLEARFNGAGVNPLSKAYTVGFDATGHIKRSQFGVTKYVPLIGDDVNLTISAAFERKAA
jgi:polyisoprenoid-binding protein YceI